MVKHTKDDRPISSRVKRRLFDDEDDVSVTEGTKINVGLSADNMKLLNLCDAAEKSCHPSNAPSSTITIETDVLAEGTLDPICEILIITDCTNSLTVQIFAERASLLGRHIKVGACMPEDALKFCLTTPYHLIITEVNLTVCESILYTINEIKKTNSINRLTQVIAIKQRDIQINKVIIYGISRVYGSLTEGEIDQLLYMAMKEYDTAYSRVQQPYQQMQSSFRKSQRKGVSPTLISSKQALGSEVVSTTTSETPLSKESEDPSPHDNYNDVAQNDDMASSSCNTSYASNQAADLAKRLQSSEFSPGTEDIDIITEVQGEVADQKNAIPKSLPCAPGRPFVRPRILQLKSEPVAPRVIEQRNMQGLAHNLYPTPPQSAPARGFSYHPTMSPMINGHMNMPYIVSGTPGGTDMKITYVPDDNTRHSTKERVRRERIKVCCEQMRQLLPKTVSNSRRLDMATVLELTVMYVKIFQHYMPVVLQEQADHHFHCVCKYLGEKRKMQDEVPSEASLCNQAKYMKIDPKQVHTGSSPSAAAGLHTSQSAAHNTALPVNTVPPSVVTLSAVSTQANQAGASVQSTADPSFNPYMPVNQTPFYRPHHYANVGEAYGYSTQAIPYDYALIYQNQLAHHIQHAASQKDAMFSNLPWSSNSEHIGTYQQHMQPHQGGI